VHLVARDLALAPASWLPADFEEGGFTSIQQWKMWKFTVDIAAGLSKSGGCRCSESPAPAVSLALWLLPPRRNHIAQRFAHRAPMHAQLVGRS
jgi:hypothetical protein